MKKFIKYCIVFLLPILVAAVCGEWAARQVPNPYRYKYEWMQENAETVETLVFGSSHTFYGIRPEFLEGKAFSLANVSQGVRQDSFLLNYWADRYKHLHTVIMPISYSTWFSHGLEAGGESFRCRYYKLYMDCNLYSDWAPYYNLELAAPESAKAKLSKLTEKKKAPGCNAQGWGTSYKLSGKNMKTWNDETEAEAAAKRHTVKRWDNIETNYGRIKQMAALCKIRGIRMILITTPCWRSYTERLDKAQLAKMYELTSKFQEECQVEYIDYLKDPRFEADDFYNSDHLSDVGAVKLTKILQEDIKRTAQDGL